MTDRSRPTVDAHVHVWRSVLDYPEPGATIVSPVSDVPVSVLNEYMVEYGVDRAVLVQPICAGEDNGYIADLAELEPERFAAVCVVDPRAPEAVDRLEYWARGRGCRGLRLRPKKGDEEASFGAPVADALWQRCAELGLVVSVYAGPAHLRTLSELAARFPDVAIVVDHMAHPAPSRGAADEEFRQLLALARRPRVFVKVSGHHYFSDRPYPYEDCWPLVRALYDEFGPERLIWGSDFPHVLLTCGYRRSLLLLERVHDFLASGELGAIIGGNSAQLYWGSLEDERAVQR